MSDFQSLIDALRALEAEATQAVSAAGDVQALEAARILFLGRKDGRISGILRGLGGLAPEERPGVGAEANRVKEVVQVALDQRRAALEAGSEGALADLDLSLPGRGEWRGGRHPVTQVIDEIWTIFQAMGFSRARGPEVETD